MRHLADTAGLAASGALSAALEQAGSGGGGSGRAEEEGE
jgi:hypothetical protein